MPCSLVVLCGRHREFLTLREYAERLQHMGASTAAAVAERTAAWQDVVVKRRRFTRPCSAYPTSFPKVCKCRSVGAHLLGYKPEPLAGQGAHGFAFARRRRCASDSANALRSAWSGLFITMRSSGIGRKASKMASLVLDGPVCRCSRHSGTPGLASPQQPGQRQNPLMAGLGVAVRWGRTGSSWAQESSRDLHA